MRNISSPLDGFSSPFGQRRNPFAAYAANGLRPEYVADFGDGFFGANSAVSTLAGVAEFSRASAATYLDADGVLQTAATGVPRYPAYTYGSGVLTGPYLQLESAARTNLLTHPEDFSNAAWTKSQVTITANATTAPDGTTTADLLAEDSSTNFHTIDAGLDLANSTAHAVSVWLKAAGRTKFYIRADYTGSANWTGAVFDLSAETATVQEGTSSGYSGTAAGIIAHSNGWYLCYVTFTSSTAIAAANPFFGVTDGTAMADVNGVASYAGDGSSGVYLWGAQLEAGSTPSSYIPTSGTRAAETLTAPYEKLPWGAAVSHALKGKITYADLASATQVLLYDRRVDANNRITLALDTAGANTGKFALTMVVGGVSATISTTAQLTPGIDQDFNVAFACTSTALGIALNGTAETRVSHALGLPALSTTDATLAGMVFHDTALGWAVDIGNTGLAEATA